MIRIQIEQDEVGRIVWKATTNDLAQVHWILTIVRKTVLEQGTTPMIQAPGPLLVPRFGTQ